MISTFGIIINDTISYVTEPEEEPFFEVILFAFDLLKKLSKEKWRLRKILITPIESGKQQKILIREVTYEDLGLTVLYCVKGVFSEGSIVGYELLKGFQERLEALYRPEILEDMVRNRKVAFQQSCEEIAFYLEQNYGERVNDEEDFHETFPGDPAILYTGISCQGLPIVSKLFGINLFDIGTTMAEDEFQRRVDEFISSELGADYSYISVSPRIIDARPFKWMDYDIKPRYSYSIELSKGIDEIWKNITKNLRNDINRARREGIIVKSGSKKELIRLYDLLVKRYADQGKIVNVSKEYLLDIYKAFYSENLGILVAEYNGDMVTGIVDLYYNDRTYFWIGNPRPYLKIPNANELLTWESIQYAFGNGYKYYEIIGIATMERLYKHYSKLNPNFSAYFSATKYNLPSKVLELAYKDILKPIRSKLHLKFNPIKCP